MKVRIGYGIGTQGLADGGARFAELIDALEALGFDSIWCSERATGPIPEPMVSLAYAAGRTKKLKLGTSVQVLPGRNPVLLAKQWASLDVLSGGRALPAFGLGVVEPMEQQAFGVAREERAPWFDEALPLIRRLWSEPAVDHDGARFHYDGRVDRHRARSSSPSTCGWADARRASCAGSVAWPTAGSRASALPRRSRTGARSSKKRPPAPGAPSTTSTTAPWSSTGAPRCRSPTPAWRERGSASIPPK